VLFVFTKESDSPELTFDRVIFLETKRSPISPLEKPIDFSSFACSPSVCLSTKQTARWLYILKDFFSDFVGFWFWLLAFSFGKKTDCLFDFLTVSRAF
jgi:hypothetical protein